jgi:hypothetical protein
MEEKLIQMTIEKENIVTINFKEISSILGLW